METQQRPSRSRPWYGQHPHWTDLASRFHAAYRRLSPDARAHAEVAAFQELSGVRLVFESNLLEGAGLSLGDTRAVVAKYFPSLPDTYSDFKKLKESGQQLEQVFFPDLGRLANIVASHGLSVEKIRPSVSLAGKSRPILEVIQHHMALLEAMALAYRFTTRCICYRVNRLLEDVPVDQVPLARDGLRKAGIDINQTSWPARQFISEAVVKQLHATIANDLLPADAGVTAGCYRIDARTVGWDIAFPSPELVPACMAEFEARADTTLYRLAHNEISPYSAAALISYDFVRIHPFPDFNGRISRVLLSMVLLFYGIPFFITLRGDRQGRARYFRALRKANAGGLRDYETLIAMQIAKSYEEIDANLMLAGLPSLLSSQDPRVLSENAWGT